MFKALQKMKGRKDRGFTLVELLIVVAIIGILAAIAIPQFGAYRRRGFNASANSDLRNIRTSEEAMMADFTEYGVTRTTTTDIGAAAGQPGRGIMALVAARTQSQPNVSISLSPNVIAMATGNGTAGTDGATAYAVITAHASGDQYYGANSGDTTIYRKGAIVTPITTGDVDDYINATGNGTNPANTGGDLTGGNWVSVQ